MTDDPFWWTGMQTPMQHSVLRQHVAKAWGAGPVFSIALSDFRPAYQVEGRRRNGSVAGRHRVRWFFGRLLLPVRNVVLSLVALPFGNGPYPGFRTSTVTGPANCMALAFADANKADQQRLEDHEIWLVWTRDRAELVRVQEDPPLRLETLWRGEGPYRPTIDGADRTLRWPDGSIVVLDLGSAEAERAAVMPR